MAVQFLDITELGSQGSFSSFFFFPFRRQEDFDRVFLIQFYQIKNSTTPLHPSQIEKILLDFAIVYSSFPLDFIEAKRLR